jgi:hypothetical protein
MTALTEQYVLLTRDRPARIDWQLVEEAYRRRDGIPALVGSGLEPSGPKAMEQAMEQAAAAR